GSVRLKTGLNVGPACVRKCVSAFTVDGVNTQGESRPEQHNGGRFRNCGLYKIGYWRSTRGRERIRLRKEVKIGLILNNRDSSGIEVRRAGIENAIQGLEEG